MLQHVFILASLHPCAAGEEEEKKKRKKKKRKEGATAQAPAEEVKEQAMEAEATEQKKDFDPEATGAHKTPGKLSEKKRRRSHTAEGSESDVPSKIRKISESEGGEREKDGAQSSKSSLSHQCKKRKLQKNLNGQLFVILPPHCSSFLRSNLSLFTHKPQSRLLC